MKKLIKFCKIPLMVISSVIIVAFMVLAITLACTYVGKYTYNYEFLGVNMDTSYTFNKKNGELTTYVKTYGYGDEQIESYVMKYKVEKGKLYVSSKSYPASTAESERDWSGIQYASIGTINSFKITYSDEYLALVSGTVGGDYGELTGDVMSSIELKCNWACALRDLSISMDVIFAVALAAAIVITVLDKKGKLLKKKEQPETQEEESQEVTIEE